MKLIELQTDIYAMNKSHATNDIDPSSPMMIWFFLLLTSHAAYFSRYFRVSCPTPIKQFARIPCLDGKRMSVIESRFRTIQSVAKVTCKETFRRSVNGTVNVLVSGTLDVFDVTCKQYHSTTLNRFLHGRKNGDVDGARK